MKDDLVNSNMTNEERAKRNAELRERMNRMKKDMNGSIGKIMNKMLGMILCGTTACHRPAIKTCTGSDPPLFGCSETAMMRRTRPIN